MKRKKLIIFFILTIAVFIFWTLCDYFLGFGFGVYFSWEEFFNRLPWTITGCVICSLWIIFEDGDDLINWWEKRKKKNKDNILLNE